MSFFYLFKEILSNMLRNYPSLNKVLTPTKCSVSTPQTSAECLLLPHHQSQLTFECFQFSQENCFKSMTY